MTTQQKQQFEKNYQYYLDNYDNLVKLYDGKVLVIVDCKVAEVCDSEDDAYYGGMKKYGLGNFLIQKCTHEYKTRVLRLSPSHFIPRITPNGVLPPLIRFLKDDIDLNKNAKMIYDFQLSPHVNVSAEEIVLEPGVSGLPKTEVILHTDNESRMQSVNGYTYKRLRRSRHVENCCNIQM